jgi:hypothetical protein
VVNGRCDGAVQARGNRCTRANEGAVGVIGQRATTAYKGTVGGEGIAVATVRVGRPGRHTGPRWDMEGGPQNCIGERDITARNEGNVLGKSARIKVNSLHEAMRLRKG